MDPKKYCNDRDLLKMHCLFIKQFHNRHFNHLGTLLSNGEALSSFDQNEQWKCETRFSIYFSTFAIHIDIFIYFITEFTYS